MRWLVVVLTLVVAGCMGPDGPMTERDSRVFMTGCLQACEGERNCYPICSCADDEMRKRFTRYQLRDMDTEMARTGRLTPQLAAVHQMCTASVTKADPARAP